MARLDENHPLPQSLKGLVNEWCAAKGPEYLLRKLPFITQSRSDTLSASIGGRKATWWYEDKELLEATMYPLEGNKVDNKSRKFIVVEGKTSGPFLVRYTAMGNNTAGTYFKCWVGLNGDENGFEAKSSVTKNYAQQTHTGAAKSKDGLPRFLTTRNKIPDTGGDGTVSARAG